MLVFDSHLDLAWNALNWNRDLARPIDAIRRAELGMEGPHRGANTVCFEEMQRGEVGICLATVLARSGPLQNPLLDYRSPEIASAMAHGQRTYYQIMQERGLMRNLRNWPEVEAHVSQWRDGSSKAIGYVLSMEGADPILSPRDAASWWKLGLRVAGLSHYGPGVYAAGTNGSGGLSAKGLELLRIFEDLGMILDVTHLTDQGFWEALDRFHGPVLASHNNCRALVPGERQFSDEQLEALISRQAVIGAAFDSWMILPDYVRGQTDNALVKLRMVADHIDHVCQLAGNALHSGIGSDLDGGFGREQSPGDLETIADLQKVAELLKEKGMAESEIEGVMHANWLRFFKNAWTHQAA